MINPYSTNSLQNTATLIIPTETISHMHMHTTESSTQPYPTEEEILQSWRKITGGVLGALVIILGCTLSIIGIVVVVIHKKGRKASIFDLTTNEAYTQREIRTPLINGHDGDTEAIEYCISDVSKVPMELNAAYMVKSSIKATRNVAYENTCEFSGYEYVNAQ